MGTVPDWMTMPKNRSSARRNAARALAASKNITYAAALRRLASQSAGGPVFNPVFNDDDFRIASRAERYPSSQHLPVARRDGHVELRASAPDSTPAYPETAIRFTEDQFDRYQLGARAGHPEATPLAIDRDVTGTYTYRNAEDEDSNTLTSDQEAFLTLLDGVVRGDFGGPTRGVGEGMTTGGVMRAAEDSDH